MTRPDSRTPTPFWRLLLLATLAACAEASEPVGPPWAAEGADLPLEEPRPFAEGVLSTSDAAEFGITFAPDGRTAWFTRRSPRERQQLRESSWDDDLGGWREPRPLPFATESEESPWMTPDGSTLYFASRRDGLHPEPDPSDDLWRVERTATGWGEPEPVRGVSRARPDGVRWPVHTELNPVVADDGALWYWTQEAGAGYSADIYRALPDGRGGFEPGRALDPPVNTNLSESHFALLGDSVLIFQAFGRDTIDAGEDLYLSLGRGERWSEPVRLPPPINSGANDGFPSLSPDGRWLFFASDRQGPPGRWSIWWVSVDALPLGPES